MEGCDAVFHSAAYVAVENINSPLMHEINVVGTKNICQAALAANISKLIHF
jgi:nucleoside-diphosphate-sugar epimerase